MTERDVAQAFRLLPSEELLWHSRPLTNVPRDRAYSLVPLLFFALAVVAALFAALLEIASLPGFHQVALVSAYLAVVAIAALLLPRYLLDTCAFAITDRRVLWRRGRSVRSMERSAVTFARVRWNRSVAGVGHLELVRSIPFGPLSRSLRIVFHDVKSPDALLSLVRGVDPAASSGDGDVPLTDRLDGDERVLWGAGPEGMLLGWRDVFTALGGAIVVALGVRYGLAAGTVLLDLESIGLRVGSPTWLCLFAATMITFAIIVAVGGGLVWWGVVHARSEGRQTEYIVTDRRLLIRRGRTELSLDRARICDVAETPSWRGLRNVFLILDGPGSKALGVSGALSSLPPSRDSVPPVLYELGDVRGMRAVLLGERERLSDPDFRDAA